MVATRLVQAHPSAIAVAHMRAPMGGLARSVPLSAEGASAATNAGYAS